MQNLKTLRKPSITEALGWNGRMGRVPRAGRRIDASFVITTWGRALSACALDGALEVVGVALAGISVSFAAVMLTTNHEPFIRNIQDFAIFAQPNSSAAKRSALVATLKAAPSRSTPGIDYTPTGSVSNSSSSAYPEGPLAKSSEYEILGATGDTAWLRIGSEIIEARKGSFVPNVGKILAIQQRQGRWRLILEGDRAEPRRLNAPSTGSIGTKKFSAKPFIFSPPDR